MTTRKSARTTGLASPTEAAAPLRDNVLSADLYTSEDIYRRELETLWANTWLLVGRESDLEKPGDYFLFEMEALSLSVVVIKGSDGRIRGFHNVCAHRGARLCHRKQGTIKALACAFHGWVYDLKGALAHVPDEKGFMNLDRGGSGLKPVAVDCWGGFVFVNFNPAPDIGLGAFLGRFPEALGRYCAERDWRWFGGSKVVLNANWKLAIDGQMDGYHPNTLHKRTIGMPFGEDDVQVAIYPDPAGVPAKITVHQPVPSGPAPGAGLTEVTRLAAKYSTIATYMEKDTSAAAREYEGAFNTARNPRWVHDSYSIVPNAFLMLQQDMIMLMRSWPLGVDRSLCEWDYYFIGGPRNFGDLLSRTHVLLFGNDINGEDLAVGEETHQSYRSGVIRELRFGRKERPLLAYEHALLKRIGGE